MNAQAEIIRIPITFIPWPGGLNTTEAAAYMGIGLTKIWELKNRRKGDPLRLNFTSYGRVHVSECDRQMMAEIATKGVGK